MTFYLKPGVISSNQELSNMLGDFIAWARQDAIMDAMRARPGYSMWEPEDHYMEDPNDVECKAAMFDLQVDLTPLLPPACYFGFTESGSGKLFEVLINRACLDLTGLPGDVADEIRYGRLPYTLCKDDLEELLEASKDFDVATATFFNVTERWAAKKCHPKTSFENWLYAIMYRPETLGMKTSPIQGLEFWRRIIRDLTSEIASRKG